MIIIITKARIIVHGPITHCQVGVPDPKVNRRFGGRTHSQNMHLQIAAKVAITNVEFSGLVIKYWCCDTFGKLLVFAFWKYFYKVYWCWYLPIR